MPICIASVDSGVSAMNRGEVGDPTVDSILAFAGPVDVP